MTNALFQSGVMPPHSKNSSQNFLERAGRGFAHKELRIPLAYFLQLGDGAWVMNPSEGDN